MRKIKKERIIRKIDKVDDDPLGDSMYLRPYRKDQEIIDEIARASSKKKSEIAQKLLRHALRGKKFEVGDKKEEAKKIDWLINNEKHKNAERDVFAARLERLEEHARELENSVRLTKENSELIKTLSIENHCINIICMSYLNQIFTKFIQYLSPNEIERNNSSDFANRNILGLIMHSISELEKLSGHYDLDDLEPETLYLFTKIKSLKERMQPVGTPKN